jgi:ribonucleoside-diphosphate reductase beta chain
MAWGTFTCRRHVAADDANWSVVEDQMAKLMEPALALTDEIYNRFDLRDMPFGIDPEEMSRYASSKLSRRLESIQSARGRPVPEIDDDYSPMELEDRFGEEDARVHAAAAAV